MRELVLHLYRNVVDDLLERHHDGRVARESVLRRCICEVHVLELRRCTYVARELALRHRGERVVRVLVPRLYKSAVGDLLVHHHDGRESELRRCTCAVRVLDDRLRNDCALREFRLVFRHLYVVVCPKDSKHRCCAWRHELPRAEIQRDFGHLGRVVREVHGIRLLPPLILAWRAS